MILLVLLPIYAIIALSSLLDVHRKNFTGKKVLLIVLVSIVTLIVNCFVFFKLGLDVYRRLYILMIQIPLYLIFRILSDYHGIRLLFTLLTTIIFASLPINFVIIVRILTDGNGRYMLAGFLLATSIIFAFIHYFFRSRYLFMLKFGGDRLFWKFSIIPIFYYTESYLNSGYNFMQYHSLKRALLALFPGAIVFLSYLMLLDIFKSTYEKQLMKRREDLALMEIATATSQIEQLKKSEQQSAIYRHDLRHHMNYLNTCIEENHLEEAKDYITQVFERMDSIKVDRYSSNESINLILSSYAAKAENKSVSLTIRVTATDFSRFQIMDLCTLLSNALENALNACEQAKDPDAYVNFHMYEKNHKLCISIRNSYTTPPAFREGIPVSFQENHSFGAKSMVYVVEKYQGIYNFRAEDGVFLFQASM